MGNRLKYKNGGAGGTRTPNPFLGDRFQGGVLIQPVLLHAVNIAMKFDDYHEIRRNDNFYNSSQAFGCQASAWESVHLKHGSYEKETGQFSSRKQPA